MKVYFKNSKGNEILIGEAEDDNRAFKIIEKFCHERNFKIYYTRAWNDPDNNNRKIYDVGDHFSFFIVDRG